MAKFLFFTDLHFKTMNPVHRTGSYPDDICVKLTEVYKIANQEKVDCVLFGGDFFDAYKSFDVQWFRKIRDIICDSGLKTYAIIGQHNLLGYNLETYVNSTTSLLEELCGKDRWETIKDSVELNGVEIHASHCTGDFEGLKEILAKPKKLKKKIVLAHCLLYTATDKLIGAKDVKEFKNDSTDLVFSGDLHCGYPPQKVGRTMFANPGALCRKEINEDRPVQVALVEMGENSLDVKYVPLASARPYEEAFEVSQVELIKKEAEKEKVDEATREFAEKIRSLEVSSEDVFSLLDKAANIKGVDKDVREFIQSFKESSAN